MLLLLINTAMEAAYKRDYLGFMFQRLRAHDGRAKVAGMAASVEPESLHLELIAQNRV